MSDEELKEVLSNSDLEAEDYIEPPDEEGEYEDIADVSDIPDESGEEGAEISDKHPETDENPEAEQGSQKDQEIDWKEEAVKLKKELEKEKESKQGLESVLGRQGQQLGDLRKQIETLTQQLTVWESPEEQDKFNDKFIHNPYQAAIEITKKERETEQTRKQLQELQRLELAKTNEIYIKEKIPNFDELKEDISEILRSDGVAEPIVKAVMSDIYVEDPAILMQLAKRAEIVKENRELKSRFNNEKSKSDRVLGNVEKAAEMRTALNTKTPSSTRGMGVLTEQQIWAMSPEEVKVLANKLFRQ